LSSHLLRGARRLVLVVPIVLALAPATAHAAAELAISPEEIDFGTVSAGTSADRTATIRNLGPDATALSDFVIFGTGLDQFDFGDSTCVFDAPMAPGAECELTMRFSAAGAAPGAYEAFLAVEGGPDDTPGLAHMTGSVAAAYVGPARIVLEPGALHFAETPVGTVSPVQHLVVRNAGGADATQLTVRDRPGGSYFNVSNACPVVLAPGAECTVAVAFAPKDLASRLSSSSLRVSWSGHLVESVRLSGHPVPAPDPYLATSRELGDLADFVPKALRGGPRSFRLSAFRAPAAGTLKLRVHGWLRGRRVLVARGSQPLAAGAEHRLRVTSTKKGRKLLRRPRRIRIKAVLTYTDQVSGRVIRQAPEYMVKRPKASKPKAERPKAGESRTGRKRRPPGRHKR
jgi:hypothetical protein